MRNPPGSAELALATFHTHCKEQLAELVKFLQSKGRRSTYEIDERFAYVTCGANCFWVTVELRLTRRPWRIRATFDPRNGSSRESWSGGAPVSDSDWQELIDKAVAVLRTVK